MSRKFMIVKPTDCCGYAKGIGRIYSALPDKPKELTRCLLCGEIWITRSSVAFKAGSNLGFIDTSRIVWLPDEKDVIENDNKLELDIQQKERIAA